MFPKLFDIGPLPVHTYGLLLAAALLISIWLTARLAEPSGIPRKVTWDLGFVVIISSILGAKLLLLITSFDYYFEDPSRVFSLDFLRAGGVYYGGLFGALLGTLIFVSSNRSLSFWDFADPAAPSIALGQSIGRLGCFAAGCDYGKPCDLPWAVVFRSEYAHNFVGVPLGIPLHPYQLYEAGAMFLMFLGLLWTFHHRRFSGQVFSLYLIGYGIVRFALEFFRGDADRGFLFDGLLSTSQFISLLVVPLGLLLLVHRWRQARPSRG